MSTNLGDLLKKAGFEASARGAEPEPAAVPEAGVQFGPKVVLRATKRGRGGKTVTEIQGVLTSLDALARDLRTQLGVGAKPEGELIIVQGDQRTRLAALLEARGAKKVVVA
ncbi:MAG: translation initiation factor [Myxococcota bacterium]